MHSKRSSSATNENGAAIASVSTNTNNINNFNINNNNSNNKVNGMETRTSSRIQRPPMRGIYYYSASPAFLKNRKKSKTRTAAAHIAKLLKPGGRRPLRNSKKSISNLLKPKKIRLGNWETEKLSRAQLQYAATNAFASWYLYEVLKSFPYLPEN